VIYLLDTDVLIDLQNRIVSTIAFVAGLGADAVFATAAPIVAELMSGLDAPARERAAEVLADYLYLDVPWEAAVRAGEYRFEAARRGRPMTAADSLIAGVAWHHGVVLVTRNVRHFPMTDITVIPPN